MKKNVNTKNIFRKIKQGVVAILSSNFSMLYALRPMPLLMNNNICVIGLGSNIEPQENISKAIELIKEEAKVLSISSLEKTKPIGKIEQPDFLNGAVKVSTRLPKTRFKEFLKSVENRMGRDRSIGRYGPRNIDLDVVVWNGKIIDSDYYKRDFLKNSVDELI